MPQSYPLPKTGKLVNSIAGHELLSFIDAFLGYDQIPLDKEDQEKNSFYYRHRLVLLQLNVIWLEQCRSLQPITCQ